MAEPDLVVIEGQTYQVLGWSSFASYGLYDVIFPILDISLLTPEVLNEVFRHIKLQDRYSGEIIEPDEETFRELMSRGLTREAVADAANFSSMLTYLGSKGIQPGILQMPEVEDWIAQRLLEQTGAAMEPAFSDEIVTVVKQIEQDPEGVKEILAPWTEEGRAAARRSILFTPGNQQYLAGLEGLLSELLRQGHITRDKAQAALKRDEDVLIAGGKVEDSANYQSVLRWLKRNRPNAQDIAIDEAAKRGGHTPASALVAGMPKQAEFTTESDYQQAVMGYLSKRGEKTDYYGAGADYYKAEELAAAQTMYKTAEARQAALAGGAAPAFTPESREEDIQRENAEEAERERVAKEAREAPIRAAKARADEEWQRLVALSRRPQRRISI